MKVDLSGLGRIAADLQATSDFWAVKSAPERCALQVRIGDRLVSDLGCEHEGSIVHTTSTIEASEVEQKLSAILAGPHGRDLAALIRAAQYLPARPR